MLGSSQISVIPLLQGGGPPKMPLRSHGADSLSQFLSKWSEAGAASLGFLESPSCAWLSGLSSAPTAVGP